MMNTTDIAALEEWNIRQDQMLTFLHIRVNSLQQQVSANDSDIANLINYDNYLQQLIEALNNKVTILELQVSNNTGDITALQGEIATINNQIVTRALLH